MKFAAIFFGALICAITFAGCSSTEQPSTATATTQHQHSATHEAAGAVAASASPKLEIPAHFKDAASIPKPLPPTLSPDQFTGDQVKKAYRVAQEIPETLAQLPCFCYCDRGFGHKSLHSCYEDDHSAGCSTCLDEALMAFHLQREQGLSVPQIQAQIIAKFGN